MQKSGNIFNKNRDSNKDMQQNLSFEAKQKKERSSYMSSKSSSEIDMEAEMRFEMVALNLLKGRKWGQLEAYADQHLRKKNASHYRAFFYRGVANYKLQNYEDARDDFTSALHIMVE
jgi:hypothetical protein